MLDSISRFPSKVLLTVPCTALKGVGNRHAENLAKIGITTLDHLLFHLPFRYENRSLITLIYQLLPGTTALVEGQIHTFQASRTRKGLFRCQLSDGTGSITLLFFHFQPSQIKSMQLGKTLRVFGEIKTGQHGLELLHPDYEWIIEDRPSYLPTNWTPIYSSIAGISQKFLRFLIKQALDNFNHYPEKNTFLPEALIKEAHLPDLVAALSYIHSPPISDPITPMLQRTHPAFQRIALEEILAQHLSLRRLKEKKNFYSAPLLHSRQHLQTKIKSSLTFQLTAGQNKALIEIQHDLMKNTPMLRLLQGEVGSGKTIVSALTAAFVLENDYQVALMAPTELLAEQHYQNCLTWFKNSSINVVLLKSQLTRKEKDNLREKIARDKNLLIIGTHALFQAKIIFFRLGLVIIDEQHRFGVQQRLSLWKKGEDKNSRPHQLVLSATPIPRTLMLTAYADLDISFLNELPHGRLPIKTAVISDRKRDQVISRIKEIAGENKQIYWVCPLIKESEVLQCQAAESTFMQLKEELACISIGLIHGQLSSVEKEKIMQEFKAGTLQLLVATSVIEVGVDVPNATLMIIENAERLGLAQLHQLRGRVGRGTEKSYCVLLYSYLSMMAKNRLSVLRNTHDGYIIAQKDLELRGPGELLGLHQSGNVLFRIADLQRDSQLISQIPELADKFLRMASLLQQEYLLKRWGRNPESYEWTV